MMVVCCGQWANSDGVACVVAAVVVVEERQWPGWKENQEVQGGATPPHGFVVMVSRHKMCCNWLSHFK